MTDVARKKQSRLCVCDTQVGCIRPRWPGSFHWDTSAFPRPSSRLFQKKTYGTGMNSFYVPSFLTGWLGSRVVSVLDSGAVGPGFQSQPRRCQVTVLGKLFTPTMPLFTKQQDW